MEQKIVISDQVYTIDTREENPEMFAKLAKAMTIYYDLKEKYEQIKEEYDLAHYRMEQMFGKGFEEVGLKKMSDKYLTITYIPETQGTTKISREPSKEKMIEIMNQLGIDEEEYMETVEKTTGKRKAYIKETTK